MDDGIGARFWRETRHHRGQHSGHRLDWAARPAPYKSYPAAQRIGLPLPAEGTDAGLFDSMARRRSVRRFAPEPLTLSELARLLWAAAGVSTVRDRIAFRTAPSAGALYPIETYVDVHRVDHLDAGLYHHNVVGNCLERLRRAQRGDETASAALDQRFLADAAVVFVWTAVFERCRWKYGERAFRYICLDAGHIAQNVALAAVGLGLGSCQIAAIYDDEADDLLGVDSEEEGVVYMTAVGRPA